MIDIQNFKETKEIIMQSLESGLFENRLEYVLKNRNIALNDFNFLHRILEIVNKFTQESNGIKRTFTIHNQAYFLEGHRNDKSAMFNASISLLVKFDRLLQTNFSAIFREILILLRYNLITKKYRQLSQTLRKFKNK